MKEITYSLKIYDNIIELTPDEPIQDNSIYEISIDSIKAYHKEKFLYDIKEQVYTKMTPSYCSLEGVKSLVEAIDLPDDKTLYYIREASRKADYLSGKSYDSDSPPFEVNQFVKYRAAHDTLLKYTIDRATFSGLKGTMGEIQFEASDSKSPLQDLLQYLKAEAVRWEQEIMGDDYRKGARPKAVTFRKNPSFYSTKISGFGRETT